MNKRKYAIFMEMQKLIAKYDWAIEGMPDPYDTGLSEGAAVEIRNALVEKTSEITRGEE